MVFEPNPLYFTMAKLYSERVTPENKLIIGNEGSSRSSKTWDAIHFIVAFCDANRGTKQDIYIIRDTLVDCRDYTLKEFKDCLTVMGLWSDRNLINSPKPVYKLFGQSIRFRGMDDKEAEGYPSDILFFNEILSGFEKDQVMGLIMRCRKLVIMDWNPKYTDHWVFGLTKRKDCVFTKSTYKQNRHLQQSVIAEIESFSPWHLDDLHLPESQRRPHLENIANGTADKYRFMVYGMGERANREGLVFPDVTWIDDFPEDVEQTSRGVDYGETAQTAIVKTGYRPAKDGKGKPDLFIKKLFYHPTQDSDVIHEVLISMNPKDWEPFKDHAWVDNNQPGWTSDLGQKRHKLFSTSKFPGSREYWITSIKRFNIHIVKDDDFRREQENFSYRVVDGKQLSETIKKFDHLWSATGYSVVGDFVRFLNRDAQRET